MEYLPDNHLDKFFFRSFVCVPVNQKLTEQGVLPATN